jgi:hypothetical protein
VKVLPTVVDVNVVGDARTIVCVGTAATGTAETAGIETDAAATGTATPAVVPAAAPVASKAAAIAAIEATATGTPTPTPTPTPTATPVLELLDLALHIDSSASH